MSVKRWAGERSCNFCGGELHEYDLIDGKSNQYSPAMPAYVMEADYKALNDKHLALAMEAANQDATIAALDRYIVLLQKELAASRQNADNLQEIITLLHKKACES